MKSRKKASAYILQNGTGFGFLLCSEKLGCDCYDCLTDNLCTGYVFYVKEETT